MTDIARRESEILLDTALDGAVEVGALFRDETAWLTQRSLAELFGAGVPAVNKHLKNIFESGELDPVATVSRMEVARSEGRREVTHVVETHDLDAIIAVGYRVHSYQATRFRIWARRGILMKMTDWATFLIRFLGPSSVPILIDEGKVSALEAKLEAEGEHEGYRRRQDVSGTHSPSGAAKRHAVGEPRARAETCRSERENAQAVRATRAREAAVKARQRRLDALELDADPAWGKLAELVDASDHDEAMMLAVDSTDLAAPDDDARILAARFETMGKRSLRRRGFFDRWKRRQHEVAMVGP